MGSNFILGIEAPEFLCLVSKSYILKGRFQGDIPMIPFI